MKALSYNGINFADLDINARIIRGLVGPDRQPRIGQRTGSTPAPLGLTKGSRPIVITFYPLDQQQAEKRLLNLLRVLDPDNEAERELVAEVDLDGDDETELPAAVNALVGQWAWGDGDAKSMVVTFHATDPVWRRVVSETKTATQTISGAGITIPIVNTGHAPANLIVTIAGTSTGGVGSASKLASRRTFTVGLSAVATDPLRNQWVRIPLLDTTPWVGAGKALSDGSNVYVFTADGQEIRRELINFNDTVSYMGIVVSDLAPGVTREYVIAYGNALATAPLDLGASGGSVDAKRAAPVFDTTAEANASTSVTATTITRTGAGWATDEWAQGDLEFLTGAAAGQTRGVNGNTADTITVASAFSPAPANGDRYFVHMSRTDKYVYDARQVEDNTFKRGLWWINRGQSKPSRFSFDAPGSWSPILTIENNDDKVQKLWTPFNPGGTTDYKAILDVNYGWDGRFSDAGDDREVANGVTFSSPIPITAWRAGWSLKNPNGICRAVLAMREAGATDWEEVVADTTQSDTLVDTAAVTRSTVPVEGVTKHLAAFLLPFNETEIPLDWIKDTGTATSGSATQLNDNTKEWQSDQYINGRIRLLSGAGAPQNRSVSDSSPNTITPSVNFSPAPDDTTRYQVTNKPLLATLRAFDEWVLTFDASSIVVGAVSAESDNYDLALTVRLDGGSPAAGPYQRARIGLDGRRVMIATGEALRIDGERRAVEIVTADTGAFVRTLAEGVVIQRVDDDDDAFLSGDWLTLTPGTHTTFLEWAAGNAPIGADITASWVEGVFG